METNIDLEEENKAIAREYKELLRISYQTLSDEDKKLIRLAFDTAVDAHKNQRRKSGEPYIFHPIAVAKIVASQIGLDAVAIASALLHDVVEDTDYTIEDMERLFGNTVAHIVEGLTKISSMSRENDISLQAENFRKLLLTMNDDVRVILIKIADRLHNMQTMDSMAEYKQAKIASETLYIYAPIAHRIGLYNIKTELEDLALKYTDPERYNSILNKMEESKEEQQEYIEAFTKIVETSLTQQKIDYSIKGRPKSIYSIYRKMESQGVSFEEVYDKFAIRIIYKSEPAEEKFLAWKIYSIVTDHFRPNPTRLRDWISSPKSTGYEALHITVMGPKGKWVEVQIRSERMHEIAEKGYAAHFKYKHGDQKEEGIEMWLNRLQEIFENSEANAVDFVEDFKLNLYSKEIFVFTPNGEIKSLPKGATPLDFAFYIHTGVGLKTRGAKVNNKLVPLNYVLKSGETVEIITAENVKPTKNWLNYATTAKARSKIKNALKEETKTVAAEGKEILVRKLKQLKITLNEEVMNEMVSYFKTKTSLDIYYQAGTGEISNQMLKDFVSHRTSFFGLFKNKAVKKPTDEPIYSPNVHYDSIVFGKEEESLDYTFSKCCNPIPGDPIFGFVTINEGVKVHKKTCPNAISMQSNYAYRIIQAKWVKSDERDFKVSLKISGIDRDGLISDISKVILDSKFVKLTNINIDTEGNVFSGKVSISINNNATLKKLMQDIKNIKGVDKVNRL
ncbi:MULTISPECIES: bifunctional (p)ppGpp synthetase/guanosine-3',5'-bis(diphosphate) 3'-pyrophosphohydrolase [Capnocytophaga]|uniref:Bifunctional (P)ppGpp synthase/hydrolase RelA n=1 Tax=Capnocytophaga ochracea TaxID=1018 RepID=A0A2X2RI47_CAPOC|nr:MULTISPECIES: bifunctional (p)ppGpp synthetase/guanosine-3',5'-bis(diphosphate) 3'-pyrophosphohydrolase [Capnocytophaga]AVM54315.1 bifunctional (p)ppGpp synthetase/guanosine-3',5'-bis(diphosphate) 3'-pyrophosphohydrolase [Capnocytophaga sp. oral taxon 864]EKY09614.1 putative GTP diphosphokinase [Capnocytophaga sp. oral taxon 380 str. F0488]EPD99634.1 GTP pyrophosphokinase [Capnocytophaga sp. oral taxon 336 str. F0502]SQA78954.1 Bifunctional (p)ppGpp synthase/hydrolase RelA [Capnocytophaga oc